MLLWDAMSRAARMRGAQENLLIVPAIGGYPPGRAVAQVARSAAGGAPGATEVSCDDHLPERIGGSQTMK